MLKLILPVVALGMAFGLTVPAAAQEFKMTTFSPEGTTSWQLYPETFVKKVTLATDGKVKIKAYGSFVLASIFEANLFRIEHHGAVVHGHFGDGIKLVLLNAAGFLESAGQFATFVELVSQFAQG